MALNKRNSVILMVLFATFLAFMDIKDLYYKIAMTGPSKSMSFTFNNVEKQSEWNLTDILIQNNNTRHEPTNMWNAVATRCNTLIPSMLLAGPVQLSAYGKDCFIEGYPLEPEALMIGSVNIEALIWAAGLIGDAIHHPMPFKPQTSMLMASTWGIHERAILNQLIAMIKDEDAEELANLSRRLFDKFATRLDLWEHTLCTEVVEFPSKGEIVVRAQSTEYFCIWTDATDSEAIEININPRMGVYFRWIMAETISFWQNTDFFRIGNSFIRSDLRTVISYTIDNRVPDEVEYTTIYHFIDGDIAMTGELYYLMLFLEIMIIYINIGDSCTVAYGVVRPLILGLRKRKSYGVSASSTATTITATRSTAESTHKSTHEYSNTNASEGGTSSSNKKKKDSELSRVLLYTDLSSVSFWNKTLCVLLVIDAFLSWIYISPNSNVLSWSNDWFQVISAILSTFRVWPVNVIFINFIWRYTVVLMNERLAALLTEITFITSFEVMAATFLAVETNYSALMGICTVKAAHDGTRYDLPTLPGLFTHIMKFTMYRYGDASNSGEVMKIFFTPLVNVIGYSILYSLLFGLAKAFVMLYLRQKEKKISLAKFWRTYERNGIEVFTDDPLRAKALIRSQHQMSYRFGNSVYIRPFVYLEQNYHIHNGKFQTRPIFPWINFDISVFQANVDPSTYQIDGVVRNSDDSKIKLARAAKDNQIPLC